MKPMRSFGLLCLHFYSLVMLSAHAQLNFLQKHEGSSTNQTVSTDKNDIITLSWAPSTFQLELLNLERASEISNQEALESILQMETVVVLYKIKANPNSNAKEVSSSNQVKEAIIRNNNENTVLVWENTVPLNTIMLLDVLSDIQFDSKNSFSFSHKCFKKEIDFVSSGGITCVFVIKPKISLKPFGRRLQEENITLAENERESDHNNSTSNVTDTPSSNDTPPKYNSTVITANNATSNPQNNTTSNATTVKPPGTPNKPIKTDVASIHPRSFFNSIVLILAGGLVIAAIVVVFIKLRQKWKKQKFLTLPNKKIDLQKLIIRPSFFGSQPESAMVSVNSGVILKPKRSLFLSDTNLMSPVIDVKTIQHLNLEENHRSSMIPEEVILTNIDDSPESMDSSKTSDASPQDIGFNIEFSILDAQESSKFRGKNLKSEV